MHAPSFIAGWGIVISAYCLLFALRTTPAPFTPYAPPPPTYYVCGALQPDGFRVCAPDVLVSLHQAHRRLYAYLRSRRFIQLYLARDQASRALWLRAGPRCSWQHGGNCV